MNILGQRLVAGIDWKFHRLVDLLLLEGGGDEEEDDEDEQHINHPGEVDHLFGLILIGSDSHGSIGVGLMTAGMLTPIWKVGRA